MDRIKQLRQRKADLLSEADALSVKDTGGTITAEETARLTEILDKDLPAVNGQISREERLMDERRTMTPASNVNADTSDERSARLPAEVKTDGPKFTSFGEQLQVVARAGMNKGVAHQLIDQRLVYQAGGQGANEAIPSEGGFLVQQDFSLAMLEAMHEMGELLSRIRRIPISANSNGIILPAIDETSRANGSRFGGVQAYWADEGDSVTATKPKFRNMDLRLKKLMAVGYATDELLQDASALEAVLSTAFTEELTFKTEDAIISGTGAGQPLGILNSGAVVTVTPSSGQVASSLTTQNILDMWSRLPLRTRKNAVWVINQEVEQQLYQLTLGSGTAVVLLYKPPGASAGQQYGELLGRPVIPIEYASALGTAGDIILFDPKQYVMIDKNGLQRASSMHVRFLTDEMTFRFTFRVDGQPVWRSAVTPFRGNNTLSPYVVLGLRNS